MVNPRSSWFLTLLCTHMCSFVPMYLGTYIEKEKFNIMHDAFVGKYILLLVYISGILFIVSILLHIYLVTSKLHQTPLIILSQPFNVIKRLFVISDYTDYYIKCKGYSSPRIIQVFIYPYTMTNGCNSATSFDVNVLQLYDHRLAIFKLQNILDTYQNVDAIFSKTRASNINIGLLCPSTLYASPFATWYIPRYIHITTVKWKYKEQRRVHNIQP